MDNLWISVRELCSDSKIHNELLYLPMKFGKVNFEKNAQKNERDQGSRISKTQNEHKNNQIEFAFFYTKEYSKFTIKNCAKGGCL